MLKKLLVLLSIFIAMTIVISSCGENGGFGISSNVVITGSGS